MEWRHSSRSLRISNSTIIDVELKCLIDYDKISLGTTRSTFLTVKDDFSIRSFLSRSSKASFKKTSEVYNFEKDKNSNFHTNESITSIKMLTDTIDEVAVTQESHYHLPTDVLENNNSIEDITPSSSAQDTKVDHNLNQDHVTNTLESTK